MVRWRATLNFVTSAPFKSTLAALDLRAGA